MDQNGKSRESRQHILLSNLIPPNNFMDKVEPRTWFNFRPFFPAYNHKDY